MFSMGIIVWTGLICLCILLLLAAGAAYYVRRCMWWQNRIEEIREEQDVYRGWNLRRLKDTAKDLEYERVDRMELIF